MLNDPVASFHAILQKKFGKGLAWKNAKGEWEFWHSHYARDIIEKERESIRHLPNPPEGFEKAYLEGTHTEHILKEMAAAETETKKKKTMKEVVDKYKNKDNEMMTKQELRLSECKSSNLFHGIALPEYPVMVKEYMTKANFREHFVTMVSSCDCLMQLL